MGSKNRMRILLVSSQYPPEIGSASKLIRELGEGFVEKGHDVTVLTSRPRAKLATDDAGRIFSECETEEGLTVLRARTLPLSHIGYVLRGVATLLAPLQLYRCLRRHRHDRFDAVFIYSPPITFGLIGPWAKVPTGTFVLNVQDIFPQAAIDLGILKNPLLIWFFRWLEQLCYRKADIVTAHSSANLKTIAAAYPWVRAKLRVLHNWIDTNPSRNPEPRPFRQLFGLADKKVALFAGVIGPSQGLDHLVDVAARLVDLDDLLFLVVGDGAEKARIEQRVRDLGLRNVVFAPFVSMDDYHDLLACCDIGLICLSPTVRTPVVPGKMLGYMAAALPVAALVNAESDVHEIVADARCGDSCVASDTTKAEQILRRLLGDADLRFQLGRNGRDYAEQHFTRNTIVGEIEHMLQPRRHDD